MIEDTTERNIRRELVDAAVTRAGLVIHSTNEDVECVAVGRVVKVSVRHALIAIEASRDVTAIPIAAITKIARLDASGSVENVETSAPAAE